MASKYPKNQLEFERRFSSEESCENCLWQLKFPSGYVCSFCNGTDYWSQTRARRTCASCHRETSVLSGTVFSKSHLSLTVWFRCCWWFINQKQGVSALGLQRALGIGSYRSAWLALHKLRRAMITPGRNLLKGEIETDEIYIGGVESEGSKYRSNKHLILICAEKNGKGIGRIRMKVIVDTSSETLLTGVQEMVEEGSAIETDAWSGYMCLGANGYKHIRTHMGPNRKAKREQDALPRVHRIASLFKRWMLGTYQGRVDAKHLPRYLDEFVFRFNRRTSNSRGLLFLRLLENCVSMESTTYDNIIKNAP